MPAVPATTDRLGLPRYDNDTDPADFATQVNAISDLLDDLVARRDEVLPIGGQAPYSGTGDPAGDHWLLCDGRELNVADYPDLQAVIGFRYSPGGNDPGGGHFNLPDKRGRSSVGSDTMGTARGSAGRTPNSSRAQGQNGGEERHQLSIAEMPTHDHGATTKIMPGQFYGIGSGPYTAWDTMTEQRGSNTPHNNLSPYEVDNWIIRVR